MHTPGRFLLARGAQEWFAKAASQDAFWLVLREANVIESDFFYDARGARTHVLNPRGHSTYMRYDLLGRQTHTIDALGGVSYMGYDATGNRTLAQDELGNATYFAYDGLGRLSTKKDALFNTSYMGYDSRSSVVLSLDPEGRATYATYDLAGRMSTRGNALGQSTYFGFDQVSEPVLAVDPRGSPTYFRYDRVGRQTHKIDALGGVSYMVYDASGSLTLAQDELLNATYYTYDLRNRLSTTTDALFGKTYLGYDSESVVLRVDPNGRATYMAYDAAWRPVRQYHNVLGGEAETKPSYYVYDAVGKLTIVDDRLAGLGVTYFDRDALDRVVKKTTIAGAVYYEYDPRGLKVAFKDADLSKNYYVYDAAGRLVREWLDDARTAYFHHDLSGRVTKKILPQNGSSKLMTYHEYDVAGRLSRLESHAVVGGTPGLITYFAYQRDANGQPTWVRNEDDQSSYFEYDALNRLTLDERKSSSATLYGFRYAYDAAGNRDRKVTIHESNSRTYYVYDTRNLLVKEGVEGAGTGIYYDFDSARRMTAMRPIGADVQSAYFAHDQRNRATGIAFTKATSPDTTRSFGYSGAGERVFVTDDTTTYWQHDDGKLVREGSTAGAATRRYRRSDPSEVGLGTGPFKVYPATDEQGTVRKFVDNIEGGVVGQSYTDQFGVKLAEENDPSVTGLAKVRTRWLGSSVNGLNTTNDDFYLTGAGIYLPGPSQPTTHGMFVPFGPGWTGPILPLDPDDTASGGPASAGGSAGAVVGGGGAGGRGPMPWSKDCPYPTEPPKPPFTHWMLAVGWPQCLWAPHGWKQDDPDDPDALDDCDLFQQYLAALMFAGMTGVPVQDLQAPGSDAPPIRPRRTRDARLPVENEEGTRREQPYRPREGEIEDFQQYMARTTAAVYSEMLGRIDGAPSLESLRPLIADAIAHLGDGKVHFEEVLTGGEPDLTTAAVTNGKTGRISLNWYNNHLQESIQATLTKHRRQSEYWKLQAEEWAYDVIHELLHKRGLAPRCMGFRTGISPRTAETAVRWKTAQVFDAMNQHLSMDERIRRASAVGITNFPEFASSRGAYDEFRRIVRPKLDRWSYPGD